MLEFLQHYIFHWTPDRAVYIGGHTLLWDARCAGIYTGCGIGLLFLLLRGRKDQNLPPRPLLVINSLMFLPLFIDVFTIRQGRTPSNDIRFLTGILFGGALVVFLYPAFVTLAFRDGRERTAISSSTVYAVYLLAGLAAFAIKAWDIFLVYIVISGLTFLGFGGILLILSVSFGRVILKVARGL